MTSRAVAGLHQNEPSVCQRTGVALVSVVLVAVSVVGIASPSYALLPVPEFSECPAQVVALTFKPASSGGEVPEIVVSTARTKRRIASANLTTATVSERCKPYTITNRPRNYRSKRKVRAATRIECTVDGSRVRVQIGDYGEPVNGASVRRAVFLSTTTRDLAAATIGRGAQLTYDAAVCHEAS